MRSDVETPERAAGAGFAAEGGSIVRVVLASLFEVANEYPDAEELAVNQAGEVTIERADGVWVRVKVPGLTYKVLHSMALAVAKSTAQSFNESFPILFGTLPSGERLTFVGPPSTAPGVISLTMRLVRKSVVRTLDAYDGSDFFDRFRWVEDAQLGQRRVAEPARPLVQLLRERKLREFLVSAVRERLTIGVIGDTGSGKTFLMECLIQVIDEDERLITVESARELQLPKHHNKVQLVYSHFGTGAANTDASMLMAVTKRMKPRRVLLGECIGPEAFVFLNMIVSGHPGSITSWHAKGLAVARERFVLMCGQHAEAKLWSPDALRTLFTQAVDVMVYIKVDEPKPGDEGGRKHRYVADVSYAPEALAEG